MTGDIKGIGGGPQGDKALPPQKKVEPKADKPAPVLGETQLGDSSVSRTTKPELVAAGQVNASGGFVQTTESKNPLLAESKFPAFKEIKAEHILESFNIAVYKADIKLEETLKLLDSDTPLTFENTAAALISIEDSVKRACLPIELLEHLKGTKEISKEIMKTKPIKVDFANKINMDSRVYELFTKYAQTDEAKALTGAKKKYLADILKRLRLSGAELGESAKAELAEINKELYALGGMQVANVRDSKFNLVIRDEEQLAGLPEDLKAQLKAKADTLRNNGEAIPENVWVVNLDRPLMAPFMIFSENQELRKELYLKFHNRGIPEYFPDLKDEEDGDNREIITKIHQLATQKAKLLGFKNYAELSLATNKMAKDPKEAKDFLVDMGKKLKLKADEDYAALVAFQKEIGYKNSGLEG